MKRTKTLPCLVLTVFMLFSSIPMQVFSGIDFPEILDFLAPKAGAETYGALTYEVNGNEITITGCNESASGEMVIPDTIDGKSVTSIGYSAFYNCTGLSSITIPNGVTTIGDSAFDGCTGLTSITIGNSVTSIGKYAFAYCTGLTSITIPDSVTSIGALAFYNTAFYNESSNWDNDVLYCGKHLLKAKLAISGAYEIKEGTKTLADDAFSDCTGLTSITIPDSVTSIGAGAFFGCEGLTSITIPGRVTSIGDYAFDYCTGLTSITIPDSVTSIGNYAFYNCIGLTSITIPNSVTSIGNEAFCFCTRLKDVFYTGTEDEWKSIAVDEGNECLTDATIHFNPVPLMDIELKKETGKAKALDENTLGLTTNLTVDELKALLPENVILSQEKGEGVLYTGMTITLKDSKGNVVDTKTAVVMGDIDGDGKTKAADARLALRQAVGLEKLNGVFLEAAKVGGATEVRAAQARTILRAAVGLESPESLLVKKDK